MESNTKMARSTSAQAQVRSLAKAVATAFALSDLTNEDRAPRQIEYTDLPWSNPPLITHFRLGQAQLQDYFDEPMNIDADKLIKFWHDTLHMMWLSPSRLLHNGVFATLKTHMPLVKLGVRAFRFSTPIGYPDRLDAMSGLMFSLEVAHAAFISLPIVDLVRDDSNYYVVLDDGRKIGVIDGRPACESNWTFDGSGAISDLLEMPRGITSHVCVYDQIAAVRSLLYAHRAKFGHDFTALDSALQALRYLTFGTHCPDLIVQMQTAPQSVVIAKEKARAIKASIEVMSSDITDRAKLYTLRSELVPTVMTTTGFKRSIFANTPFPFTLEAGKADRISVFLAELYEKEVPCSLRDTA